jgi:hypothetical protein
MIDPSTAYMLALQYHGVVCNARRQICVDFTGSQLRGLWYLPAPLP